ncbi:MAG: TIGR02186 family protein, partial [Flavobacteriaceae bacterium]
MTVLRLALAILALSAFARPALAERLVIAVSSDDIAVTSNFSGAGIAILGSIERDAQTVARRAGYDIVVVLRGPRETLVARRRERVGGIWVNRKSVHFPGAPSLYVVLTGKPLPLVAGEAVLRKNRIGLDMLGLEAFERLSQADEVAFRQAAVRL